MISKPILKQTIKENYTLWLVVTLVLSALLIIMAAVLSPERMSASTNMMQEALGEDFALPAQMQQMTSFLGLLSQNFYGMFAVILPMVYVIITANKLIASQVDNGSMAYTLSTPTKRNTVTITKGVYLAGSVFCMFLVICVVGLLAINAFQQPVFNTTYTTDVKAAAKVLNLEKQTVSDDLFLILDNEEAVVAGAKARDLDEDSYREYLNAAIKKNASAAAAQVLGLEADVVTQNPSLIQNNDEALKAAAVVMHMEPNEYNAYLENMTIMMAGISSGTSSQNTKVDASLEAAAEVLDMEPADLTSDLPKIKANEAALQAAADAMGMDTATYNSTVLNPLIGQMEAAEDDEEPFPLKSYLYLNLGLFLLMFAISGISYFASCRFNLSKNSMVVGAGVPLAFFIFNMVGEMSEDLEVFKYLSLNSLYDTSAIMNGDSFALQFIILAVVGIVLYGAGIYIFKHKDLPL
ncbi:MAG: ABC transporter permease subunit [Anaerolineaceae bacterium]